MSLTFLHLLTEMSEQRPHSHRNAVRSTEKGFSITECIIALLLLMIVSLAIVGVMNFSFRSNADARKRYGALLLAQQRSEDVRNTYFKDLTAGTTTENNVVFDGVTYTIVKTIVDNDLNTSTLAPGPETKKITISVTTVDNPMSADSVTLTTYRNNNRPGPNRSPNPTQ